VILRRVSRRNASVAELGGAVRDLAILSRTLMARHLDSATVRQRVSDVLTGPVSGRLGSKLVAFAGLSRSWSMLRTQRVP